MDVTILLLWVVVLLILHLLVEKSLQMKTIAEAFMNTNNNMRTRTSLNQDINALEEPEEKIPLTDSDEEVQKEKEDMESDLLNFLLNGDPALSKQTEQGEVEQNMSSKPMVSDFNLVNHTNILNDNTSRSDERYQLNSGKFANLNTFDSIVDNGTEQFSSAM